MDCTNAMHEGVALQLEMAKFFHLASSKTSLTLSTTSSEVIL